MPQRGDDLIQRLQLLFGVQRSSTSQMRRSARTGPIGSHTAITSGVWCATSDALPSFHTKYSTIECSPAADVVRLPHFERLAGDEVDLAQRGLVLLHEREQLVLLALLRDVGDEVGDGSVRVGALMLVLVSIDHVLLLL